MLCPPAWVMPGAAYDLDFAGKRYWNAWISYAAQGSDPGCAVVGGPAEVQMWAPTTSGILQKFNTNTCRITDFGLWAENGTTNVCLQNRTMTNAVWTASSVTVSQNQKGADAAPNGAALVTATASNGTLLQAITLASEVVLTSAWIKRVSGSGTVSLTQDNGSTWTDITSQLTTTGFTQVKVAALQTLTNPTVGIKLGTSGDSIAVDFFQCEYGGALGTINYYATSPCVTTTAPVNCRLGNEAPTINTISNAHPSAGQILLNNTIASGAPYTIFAQYSGTPPSTGWIISSDQNITFSGGADGNGATIFGETTSNTGNAGIGNINKIMARSSGAGGVGCLNGGPLTTYNTATNAKPSTTAITHCNLGSNGSDNVSGPLNGYIQRIAFWHGEVSDGQMIELSKVVNNQ